MKPLFVKICGLTRPQDAELAAGLGASALGFVFWPGSPRSISAETARAIATNVPASVLKVGVFVDQTAGGCRPNHGRRGTGCRAITRT